MFQFGSRARAYAFAIGVVVAAAAARLTQQVFLREGLPLIAFFIAVVAASGYGGVGPGVVATLFSAAVGYWLIPHAALAAPAASAATVLLRFAFVGILIALLNDRIRRGTAAERATREQLLAQAELLRGADVARSQLAAIVESSEDAIVGVDMTGTITSWNSGAERLYGYAAPEALGKPMRLVIPADRVGEEERMLAKIREGGHVNHVETARIRKDGSRLEVSLTMSPIRDGAGRLIGASKVTRDITERRRAERFREELLEREQAALAEALVARDRLGFLAEVSAVLTSSLDYEETLDRVVHLALPRLGDYSTVIVEDDQRQLRQLTCGHVCRDKEPLVRELLHRIMNAPPGAGPPTFSAIVMQTGRPVVVGPEALARSAAQLPSTIDPELLRLGAELRPYAYVGVPLLVRGRTIGVMSFGRTGDLSRREYTDADVALTEEFARRVSPAIENARLFHQAGELNRLKDEFLTTVSHELRTPLSAILGWSHLLAGGQLDDHATSRAIQAIERNAQTQAQLVDDILDVARGMAGNLRLDLAPVELLDLARRSIDAVAPSAAAKQIDVCVEAAGPVAVDGDASRLQQVFCNILSNAVKFTPAGGRITIDVSRVDGHASVRVTDTGMGIAPSFLPYVFDKFRQADGSFTRQHGGLGLGLAIARHLIELHGGSIRADSAGEGRGATFTVHLPIPSAATAAA